MEEITNSESPPSKEQTVVELNQHGIELRAAGCNAAAAVAFSRAINISPLDPMLWSNLAAAYWNQRRYGEAEWAARNAHAIDPKHLEARANLGLILNSLMKWDESEALLKDVTADDPSLIHSQLDLGFLNLNRGDWDLGLKLYELRLQYTGWSQPYARFPMPFWQGEDLNGKTLYIQSEQGIGDTILFSRFIHQVYSKYPECKIKFSCPPEMINLFWEFRHYVEFLPRGIPWPESIDYGCYLASLPHLLGVTVDTVYPDPGMIYLRIKRQREIKRFELPKAFASLKVGICWTGNPKQANNDLRSIPFDVMLQLASDPNVLLYSLQVGPGQEDIAKFGGAGLICDISEDISGDLVRTGCAMAELDLVITCCTSVAHLAGTLDVPCWTLLCYDPYWIWLRERENTVWYSKMRLFRQPTPGDWDSVIKNVSVALRTFR